MPYASRERQKEYDKNRLHQINIRFQKDDVFVKNLKEASENKGLSVQKYILLAVKEKLSNDGYI